MAAAAGAASTATTSTTAASTAATSTVAAALEAVTAVLAGFATTRYHSLIFTLILKETFVPVICIGKYEGSIS